MTKDRRIDLVITFPEGMDIKRNIARYLKQSHSILDDYFGAEEWRKIFTKDVRNLSQLSSAFIEKYLIDYYRKKLVEIGYKEIKSGEEILIKSSQKKLPLYYLLFASKHPLGHKFWKEIRKISPTGQISFSLNNNSDNLVRENSAEYLPVKLKLVYKDYKLLEGRTKKLVERVSDGSIITRFNKTPFPESLNDVVCPHFLELKWAYGCPFDCAWCYLKGTFRFQPDGTSPKFKPLEKVKSHVDAFLAEVDSTEILNTGEIADSLMGEKNDHPFAKFIISLFEKQARHKVLFVTKSAAIKHLLDIPVSRQVVISFSLNAEEVAKKWEKKAPTIKSRIEAAQKLYNHGYEVRIRIDPMVPVENWEKFYVQLIDQLFNSFLPERVTLGSLRGLQSTINGVKDNSWVKYLSESSNWGKKVDFDLRAAMYGRIMSYLTRKYNYSNVALCKETVALWNELGLSYKKIRCNCVW